ncbi:efflux transporter outer membrane subunit [Pseudorhodoferax sp. Leaf274]|uniref:efflux transporter outer membrane subunit n=1 Tax=Pseudorhodoferax sp. Leaf274 TaxID=1736318 RepID=UPI0007030CD1|nr:efflux transporter outer membrane subunit [Pseudorhodoferax sp. Leaf274]KQP49454.1 RND transporter [Pseudorhodoferax sp. Leaf274]
MFCPPRSTAAVLAACALLAACAAGPDYTRPTLDLPAAFKEAGDWKAAEPQPAGSRQPWWTAYGDPTLDGLVQDAEAANQNLRVAEAQYRQAQALADAARAALYPTVGANAGAARARSNTGGTVRTGNTDTLGLSASWVPDLWGGVRSGIASGDANVQASADDLAGAHLSIQAALVQDYLGLRTTDRLRALYAATTDAYARALTLTRAQRAAGVALASDVALAESQLASAQAAATDLDATRALLEHAIAVLTGRAPAQFSLAPVPAFSAALPATPAGLPSQLLERRPDIAAAERRVAAANAAIGVARAAHYPSLVLSAGGGFSAAGLASLFNTPSRVWSLGAALAQTLFDGGLRDARDAQAVAAYDAAAATYKQTVLAGFQQVEDNLATLAVLDREAAYQDQAVRAGQAAERMALAQYRGGTANYLAVVTAQTLSLANQRAAVQLRGRQLAASVGLVAATGGGWTAAEALPPAAAQTAPMPKTSP